MKKNLIKLGIVASPLILLLVGVVGPVSAEPYGWSPNVDNSWGGVPACTEEPPKAPILYQPNHPALPQPTGNGEVRLQWTKVPGSTDYLIYYGLSSKNYIFSVPGTDNTDNYTITHLANRVYYFAVQAKAGCAASALSQEWAARPTGGGSYTLGAGSGSLPVTTTYQYTNEDTDTYATPTTAPEVKGVGDEMDEEPVYEEPAYEPPTVESLPPEVPVPTPTPKKGFLQWLLSLIFGKR